MLEYTELNDSQRARILAAIASSYFHANECYTQQNLDLVTALSDGEMLLTMHYYVPPIVTQGDPECGYLILRGDEVLLCTPETADAAARALIDAYRMTNRGRTMLEKKLLAAKALTGADGKPITDSAGYLQWYLHNHGLPQAQTPAPESVKPAPVSEKPVPRTESYVPQDTLLKPTAPRMQIQPPKRMPMRGAVIAVSAVLIGAGLLIMLTAFLTKL